MTKKYNIVKHFLFYFAMLLIAVLGAAQLMTLSPTFEMCVAMVQMLHKKGLSKSFHEMVNIKGFQILPVIVSVKQMGDADAGFQWAKQKLNK